MPTDPTLTRVPIGRLRPSTRLPQQVWAAAADLAPVFSHIDRTSAANLRKVLKAFRDNKIGPHHFQGSTGYGHGDWGRESLDKVCCV